jgi:DNA helicase-2/ATP-dependent DNA helicase PcrA
MAAAQRRSDQDITRKPAGWAALADLNGEQRAAAEATDRPTLVVSPAGTGKTAVLAARYRLMLEKGTPANRLLAITFSNRASQEMRDRIGNVLEDVDERDIWILTFHALGKKILQTIPKRFGLSENFRIADDQESQQIMREAVMRVDRDSLDGPQGRDRIKRMMELLDKIKNDGLTTSAVANAGRRFKQQTLSSEDMDILEEYEALMRFDNVVDYNDLILKPLLAFQQDEKLARAWSRQFEAIMIDEFQDTNKTQYELLRFFAKDQPNTLFLGDDDQLIFEWRGAKNSYVIDFEKQWPNAQVLTLRINYRNAPDILARAKSMIGRNENRRGKDMVAHRSNKATVELRTLDDQKAEQEYIAHLVKTTIAAGTPMDNIAILTRSRAEATEIALSLTANDIPCFYPDNDILVHREVRALISWARIAVNDKDRHAMLSAMATPDVGLSAAAIDKLNDWARDKEVPLIDVLRETLSDGRAKADGPLAKFIAKLDAVQKLDLTQFRAFEAISETVGLAEAAAAASPVAAQALDQAIAIFTSTFEVLGSLQAVLDTIMLNAKSTLEARQGEARVRVDTMHASKGLEFDLVIVSGWEQNHFPRNKPAEMEESRRLAYVTLSRARDRFVATVCRRRPGGMRQPSIFLTEMGLDPDVTL